MKRNISCPQVWYRSPRLVVASRPVLRWSSAPLAASCTVLHSSSDALALVALAARGLATSRHRGVLIRSFALLCKEFQYVPHACLCLRSLRKESGEAAKVHARIRSAAQDAHRRPGGGFRRPRRVRSFAVLSNWCSVVGDSFLCWNCFRGRYDGFHLAISIISGGLQCRWTMSSSMRTRVSYICCENTSVQNSLLFRSELRQGGAAQVWHLGHAGGGSV